MCTLEVAAPRFTLSDRHFASLVEHCGSLTGLHVGTISEASLALLLAKLPHLQHLGVDSLASLDTVQSALFQRCGQLRSLALTYRGPPLPAKALVILCQHLSCVEELYLHWHWFGWITDELLHAIGAHCKRLRFFSAVSSGYYSVYTLAGITALLRGCPLLKEVHIRGVECIEQQLHELRPDVTFRDETRTTCPVWRDPGEQWRAHMM
jgi:hypothetical protein